MKIKEIYRSGDACIISYTMAFLCIAATIAAAVVPELYEKLTYVYPVMYPWQVLSGVFVHGSPNYDTAGTIGHLGFNLLLVLPFGMMVEKILGRKRFFVYTMSLWVLNALTFYAIAFFSANEGERVFGAGISGIAFSYGAVGLYTLFKLFIQNKKAALKQVSFYLLVNIAVIMLIMINPFIAGVSSMIMHLVSVIAGIVFLIFFHKIIDKYISG